VEQAMKKTLNIAIAAALGLGLLGSPSFAGSPTFASYVVNGHAASPAEMQLLASYGVQPGQWVIDGYGISPAVQKASAPAASGSAQNCRYVLDVMLCD
jgi:hypothetical protein